jgi:hypothetical protein
MIRKAMRWNSKEGRKEGRNDKKRTEQEEKNKSSQGLVRLWLAGSRRRRGSYGIWRRCWRREGGAYIGG